MLFETVTLGKPFIATAYIPGQEEVNLEFIERYGLGWVALNNRDQRELIASLTNGGEKLSAMCESVDRYREMNNEATHQIPQLVQGLL
jgi:UDP-N-acetylglucosamine:LPS N-acetylglucosamine transferase